MLSRRIGVNAKRNVKLEGGSQDKTWLKVTMITITVFQKHIFCWRLLSKSLRFCNECRRDKLAKKLALPIVGFKSYLYPWLIYSGRSPTTKSQATLKF